MKTKEKSGRVREKKYTEKRRQVEEITQMSDYTPKRR